MFKRKRRRRSTWFPVLGSTYSGDETSWTPCFFRAQIVPNVDATVAPTVNNGLECFALVPDQTQQISAHSADFTLRDYVEGQDWFLDSIVGRIHGQCFNGLGGFPPTAEAWQAVLLKVGFFVADAKEDETTVPDNDPSEFDPLEVDNVRLPWIWQRSWILSPPGVAGALEQAGIVTNPTCTSIIPGLDAGCVIKTRTKRRIRKNQRIWFVASCVGYDPAQLTVTGDPSRQPGIDIVADLRIVGQMRRSRNQSAF